MGGTGRSRCYLLALCTALSLKPCLALGQGQPDQPPSALDQANRLPWQGASSKCMISNVAEIAPVGNLRCLNPDATRTFLELNGNPPQDGEYVLAPPDYAWFAIFSFDASGYIKDDEKLDPDELLAALKESNARGFQERQRLHLETLKLLGWYVTPHYDINTKELEWGTRLQASNGSEVVNYNVRRLGRAGVTSIMLVSSPKTFDQDLSNFRRDLATFSYLPGEHYEEFHTGDKIAEYGLSALVLGGAVAVASKTGFAKILVGLLALGGKFVVAAVVAAFAGIASLFRALWRNFVAKERPNN